MYIATPTQWLRRETVLLVVHVCSSSRFSRDMIHIIEFLKQLAEMELVTVEGDYSSKNRTNVSHTHAVCVGAWMCLTLNKLGSGLGTRLILAQQ